ncbi:Autotransporter beta-domain containing hypothetical protein [Phytophthora palmivora]|uniref:Uncharacterized protein n=1 Tax=Phytophthora palmivora TaxID=4796 RepID=A0A2P4Y8X4_9STRA|nr:Autotransporter beta-domain containing hypothetical protein [Phytophthora palmivora]
MPAVGVLNPRKASKERTLYIQLVFTTLFWIAFLLYIPIGLALIDEFQWLTIKDIWKTKDKKKNETQPTMKPKTPWRGDTIKPKPPWRGDTIKPKPPWRGDAVKLKPRGVVIL